MLRRTLQAPAVLFSGSHPYPVMDVNAAWLVACGFVRGDVIGKTMNIIQGPLTERDRVDKLMQAIKDRQPYRVSLTNYTKQKAPFTNNLTVAPMDASGIQVIPPAPPLLTLVRPYLAQFSPENSSCLRVFTGGRDRSNEPQAGTQGQETTGKSTKRGELPPSFDTPVSNQRINWQPGLLFFYSTSHLTYHPRPSANPVVSPEVRITPLKNGSDHSFGSRFGLLRNRSPVVWCHFLDFWRQDGENSEKRRKNEQNWARYSHLKRVRRILDG